jgi:hypothetical protein
MVISHKHRYLFIEIPLTASWAIRKELIKYYDGEIILHKHAIYAEFKKVAPSEEQKYYVFAAVRNPLDKIVSRYFKLLTDHKGAFSDPDSITNMVVDYSDAKKFAYVQSSKASFESYFQSFYKRPYTSIIDLSADNLDYVIRFESIQDGFSKALDQMSIKQIRPLPVSNKTSGRDRNFETYYTAEIVEQAKNICGPFVRRWGYEFPVSWGEYKPTTLDLWRYSLLIHSKRIYHERLRYNNSFGARSLRNLKARLAG